MAIEILLAFGAVIVLGMIVLIADLRRKVIAARKRRDRRVRDHDMQKWGFAPYERSAREKRH